MNYIKLNLFFLTVSLFSIICEAEAQNYTIQDLEDSFLHRNYLLIAERYNVDKADAAIVQERLWTNPTLEISEVNLWKTYDVETQPFLFGTYGQNQQISVDLQQLIETAGKRKKRVVLRQLEKNNATYEYEELMRDLKKELRQTYATLERISKEGTQLQNMVQLFEEMAGQYERQSQKQHIARADYYRVQSELIGLQKELVELEAERSESLHKLQALTQLPTLRLEQLQFATPSVSRSTLVPVDVSTLASEQNIGMKRQANELRIAEKQLILQRAEAKPDLTVGINYDRGGNIMKDFVGINVSLDLPVFNRNKGNIKIAKYEIEQEKNSFSALQFELENTIFRLRNQLFQYEQALVKWNNQKSAEQSQLLDNYSKHLQNKQITLLEFIDFTQAYRDAQRAYFEMREKYDHTFEELQYTVGQDF